MPVPRFCGRDPALALPGRGLRQVYGGIFAVAVLVAVGLGFWRMSPGISAVQPPSDAQSVGAGKRIPTRNLAAYDQYLRVEAQRLAAIEDAELRAVLTTYLPFWP